MKSAGKKKKTIIQIVSALAPTNKQTMKLLLFCVKEQKKQDRLIHICIKRSKSEVNPADGYIAS